MRCPVDDTQLAMSEREGIEIDYCPECRGVWLDRGELDKLIERADRDQPTPDPYRRDTPPFFQEKELPERDLRTRGMMISLRGAE